MTDLQKNRLLELLEEQAIYGLNAEEKVELENLKQQFPESGKDLSLELTAAAISLSGLEVSDELPLSLRMKIMANAEEFFDAFGAAENAPKATPLASPANASIGSATVANTNETNAARPFWQWLGWAFAAAAGVALAINLWLTRAQPPIVQNPPPTQTPIPSVTPRLSPEQERAQLITTAGDAVKIPLADPKNAKEIMGEMFWSDSLQKGYVRFNHLPVNDIARETYQLWIVDAAQNPKTPISGGVFNISSTGEVIVPVDPQIVVKKPLMIAVTVEKPGGVVVSKQERVVALAKI